LGDPLCGGCLIDACWWVRWVCVGGDGRIGRASEVGVYKSADVCIVDFAVGREGVANPVGSLFLFLRMSCQLITAAARSVVGGRLTKAASLSKATLRFADALECLDWSCAFEII